METAAAVGVLAGGGGLLLGVVGALLGVRSWAERRFTARQVCDARHERDVMHEQIYVDSLQSITIKLDRLADRSEALMQGMARIEERVDGLGARLERIEARQ